MAASVPMSQSTTLHATDEETALRLHHDVERGPPNGTESGGPGKKSLKFTPASRYPGTGTRGDPYLVDWDIGDAENPFNWSKTRKWTITGQVRAHLVTHTCPAWLTALRFCSGFVSYRSWRCRLSRSRSAVAAILAA